jgi:hypothetical protein
VVRCGASLVVSFGGEGVGEVHNTLELFNE